MPFFGGQRKCSMAVVGKKLSCCVERVGEIARQQGAPHSSVPGLPGKVVTSLTPLAQPLFSPIGFCPFCSKETTLVKDARPSLPHSPSPGLLFLGSPEASGATRLSLLLEMLPFLHCHNIALPRNSSSCTGSPFSPPSMGTHPYLHVGVPMAWPHPSRSLSLHPCPKEYYLGQWLYHHHHKTRKKETAPVQHSQTAPCPLLVTLP